MHPSLLDLIPEGKFCDVREQLIPWAITAGYAVRGVPLKGTINDLRTLQDFLRANHDAVREAESAGEILVSPEAQVSPAAVLSGPVLVGPRARIGADSVVVGPAVVGAGSVIEEGAMVSQSVLGPSVRVGRRSNLRRSIVFRNSSVPKDRRLSGAVIMDRADLPKGHIHMIEQADDGASWDVVTHRLQDRFFVADRGWYGFRKRAMDLAVVLLAAPFVGAACLVLAALVKLTSKGPALYKEKRMTQGGREFWMVKFRTMYVGAHLDQSKFKTQNQTDGPMFKIVHDPRITPLGHWLRKTSLDELPQLWNVLRGDMSLVGPRPLSDRETRWHPVWRGLRLKVKPGMTGLWQVNCGSYSDFADWIAYDVRYIQNACMRLDLWILLRTVGVVLFGRRAAAA
jgi:lipopolysaccharide/colanic/teichoic acid biosynthesis glycosyltransferase